MEVPKLCFMRIDEPPEVYQRTTCRTHIGRRGRSGGSTSRQEDLASIIARKQRQITTASLVSGCGGSAYHPVTQVQPPGRSHA